MFSVKYLMYFGAEDCVILNNLISYIIMNKIYLTFITKRKKCLYKT